MIKEKNNEYLNKLSNELIQEKKKNKKVEEKLNSVLNSKTSEYQSLQKEYNIRKNNYEQKLKEINDIKDKMKKELKVKEEQLLVMKINNEKITSLYEQKSEFLEKEVTSWKDKYHNALIETKNKENDLNKENIKLKEQNKLLLKMEKRNEKKYLLDTSKTKNNNSSDKKRNSINSNSNSNYSNKNENSKRNLNNLVNYVKAQLKGNNNINNQFQTVLQIKDIEDLQNKGSNSNGERTNNYKDLTLNNKKTKYSADGKESKVRNIEEQLINLNQYKDKINTSKDFKCKFCLKSFSFPEYKEHFNICSKNPMNTNNNNNNSNNFPNNNNKRNINSEFIKSISNSNSNSNSNLNRKNSNNRVNNSNLNNEINNDSNNNNNNYNKNTKYININKEKSNNKKYININYDNINNIRIDTNNTKNNFNNINIKINNQNININRNLININNIKKITNNIHLNSFVKNTKNQNINENINENIINNVSINNITNNNRINKINSINHSHYSNSNISNSNARNNRSNYSTSPLPNFNPKKLKIKIIKGRIRKDKTGKPYLEYIIEINYLTKNWQINKRFNQFTNLYKNLKLSAAQGGPQLPQSANIFSNIGTLFSGLSHENKIIQLEKFLKDISESDGINSSAAYKNFFEIDQFYNEYRRKRNSNINNEYQKKITIQNNNINNNEKIMGKTYTAKNNNNNYTYHVFNNIGEYSSNNIAKISNNISSSKGTQKTIQHKLKEINNEYYQPKSMANKEIKINIK